MQLLSQLVTEYISYGENVRHHSASTLKKKRIYLGQFVEYCTLKQLPDIGQISNMDIDLYHAEMSKRLTPRGSIINPTTINTGSIASIRAFYNWLEKVKRLDKASLPVIPSEIIDIKVPQKHPDVIVFSQVAKVVRKCKNMQDRLMIAVLFEAGLRIEELCDMQIQHLAGRKLSVVGKGQKHRMTFLSSELAEELQRYWDKRRWNSGAAFRPLMHDTGKGYSDTDTPRQRVKRCFESILGIKIKPHWLRHAFALNLLENGCGLRSIQKLLGHSKIETTMRYLGVTDKYLEKEYDANFGGSVVAGK